MGRAKLYQLEGIVVRRRNHGEADRIVTVFTPEGSVSLLAPGVRKPRSRKAGHLELFCRTRLLVSRVGKSWDIISQAESQIVHSRLQEDFRRGTYARYVVELVLRFFQEEGSADLFNLVAETLSLLDEVAEPDKVVFSYEQQLLTFAGFRPEWYTCVGEGEQGFCAKPLRPTPQDERPYGLDPERGGALCEECFQDHRGDRAGRRLSPSALSWLQTFQHKPYVELQAYPFPPATAAELWRLMEHYITYHLERRPAALRVMQK